MGSFFSPQQLTTRQTASTTALQPYADTYRDLLTRGLDVSNTAYNPATNAGVAGFSDPQRQAFQATQNMQGAYQPYLAAATGAATMGAAPSYSTVGNYMNPFDQYVTGSLINDYDQMINRNRQMQMSDAAKVGALTGDRRYVAQSIGQEGLDRTLASNLAQTRQAGYTQALGAAQADALRQLQATGVLSQLGGLVQQYGYNDVNAMLGIGGLQQAQEQRELDTATQNAIRQSAYPFETAQWASNLATQLGGAAGSSSTGRTVQPGPTPFQQVAGAGLAGLGMYFGAKDGGAIHGYAEGGGTPFFGGLSYVPQTQMQAKPLPVAQFVPPSKMETGGMDKLLSNFTNAYGSVKKNRKPTSTWTNPDTGEVSKYYEPTNLSKFGSWLGDQANTAWGGLSNLANDAYSGISSGLGNLSSYMPSFNFNHGGVVRHGYQDGGLTPFDYYTTYVPDNNDDVPNLIDADPRMASWARQHDIVVPNANENKTEIIPMIDQNLVSPGQYYNSKVAATEQPTLEPETRMVSEAPVPPNAETLVSSSGPEIDENTITPQSMMRAGLGDVKPPQDNSEEQQGKSLFGFHVSPDAANALVAAGLGMMASPSPFIGQAIGQGGLAGVNYYMNAQQLKAEKEKELRKELIERMKDARREKYEEGMLGQTKRANDIKEAKLKDEIYGSGKTETGLVPLYGTDEKGNTVVLQPTKTGQLVKSIIPEGVTPINPADAAKNKKIAQMEAEDIRKLPDVINQIGDLRKILNDIESDKALEQVLGPIDSRSPTIRESSSRVQGKIDQATGSAFLTAFDRLRGGGQITVTEGEKATEAISRLKNQNVSKEDYVTAINDLRKVLHNAEIKARHKAGELPLSALENLYDFGDNKKGGSNQKTTSSPTINLGPGFSGAFE